MGRQAAVERAAGRVWDGKQCGRLSLVALPLQALHQRVARVERLLVERQERLREPAARARVHAAWAAVVTAATASVGPAWHAAFDGLYVSWL